MNNDKMTTYSTAAAARVALLSVRRGQDLVFQRLLGSGHDEKFRVEARDGCTVLVIAGSFEPLLVQNGDSVTISFVMT